MALFKSVNQGGRTDKLNPTAANQLDSEQIDYYASREAGQINYDLIPLDQIDMDPTNPRTKGINPASLLNLIPKFLNIDPNHKKYQESEVNVFDQNMDRVINELVQTDPQKEEAWGKIFHRLRALATNIRLLGVKQPIEVQRKGRRYQIIYGHRRFLASILAGERTIPARVVSDERHGKKHVQASENLHQEELNLAQRLEAIDGALQELNLDMNSINVSLTANLLGYDRTLLGRYIDILRNGSPSLREAISAGVINYIHDAVKLAKLSDAACIEAMKTIGAKKGLVKVVKSNQSEKKESRGAKRKYITTPKIIDTLVIKQIVEKFELDVGNIDWKNKAEVNNVWKLFIEDMHKECKKEE